jgi:hypothetical protein
MKQVYIYESSAFRSLTYNENAVENGSKPGIARFGARKYMEARYISASLILSSLFSMIYSMSTVRESEMQADASVPAACMISCDIRNGMTA